jgi:hypothetical protein
MKITYSLLEIAKYREPYTDEKGEEAANYNLPGGWQIGCVLEGEMIPGSTWTAIKTTATETLEREIKITEQ